MEAIKEALASDIIDCIATDHAPHSKAEKELSFEEAPFGFIGLELAFSLTYTYLVKKNILSLEDLVKKMSYTPAKILGLKDKGYIKEENIADLAIVDLGSRWKVAEEDLLSKSKNTPFLGYELEAEVICTIHRGKIVYKKSG
ncbi:MAG: hypothetical protein B6D56_01820 [Candidatus Omnitrophica bacterium 4484_70.1]|nr:MAG: hypothetical protein B6D56_01820 [Candidatus Omnitrophica bacterium 4484_70.1]